MKEQKEKGLGDYDVVNHNKKIRMESLYQLGLKEGCEGVIKEIEKLFIPQFDGKKNWLISRKEWESFKNGKK